MCRQLRRLFLAAFFLCAAAAVQYLLFPPRNAVHRKEQQLLQKLAETATLPTDSSIASGQPASQSKPDLSSLTAQNSDIVAWIHIPGAGISLPVMQGADNSAYLYRNFYGEQSISGTPFLDYANSPDFSDDNSIIYGHNLFDGSTTAFSSLPRYTSTAFWQKNPEICLFTSDGKSTLYRIFAVCQFDVSAADAAQTYYRQDFRSQAFAAAYTENLLRCSVLQAKEPVPAGSRLLTLSTCDRSLYGENGRLIVVGYLIQK